MIAKRSDFTNTAWEAMEMLIFEYGYGGTGELFTLVLRKEARRAGKDEAEIMRSVAREVLEATS